MKINQIKKKALSLWDSENKNPSSVIVGIPLPAEDTAGSAGSCSGAGLPRGCAVSDKRCSMPDVLNA